MSSNLINVTNNLISVSIIVYPVSNICLFRIDSIVSKAYVIICIASSYSCVKEAIINFLFSLWRIKIHWQIFCWCGWYSLHKEEDTRVNPGSTWLNTIITVSWRTFVQDSSLLRWISNNSTFWKKSLRSCFIYSASTQII